MFHSIIYKSTAKESFVLSEIENMLLKAKKHNKSQNITGCIVYSDHQFIQIIEGREQPIKELYASIKNDERHFDVTTLIETKTKETLWDDWSMAFYNFAGSSDQNKHSRILLESYFDRANENQSNSEVLRVLKSNVLELLSDK